MKAVTIGVPTTGLMQFEFVNSLLHTVGSGLIQAVNVVPRLPIQQARQRIVETTKTEWLLFVDDDMVFTPADVEALIAADKDIVSGLFVSRSATPQPVVFDADHGKFIWKDDIPEKLEKVGAASLAFTLVKMEVFKKIGTEFRFTDEYGEDLEFCQRANDAGYEFWLEPKARIGHLTQRTLVPEPRP